MNNRLRTERWLKKHSEVINYRAIEREAKVTTGCLQKFVKYDRPLNNVKITAIENVLKKTFWNLF